MTVFLPVTYFGFAAAIFFIKPFIGKWENFKESCYYALDGIFSFLTVTAAFGANVSPLGNTIAAGINFFISLVAGIGFLIAEKISKNDDENDQEDLSKQTDDEISKKSDEIVHETMFVLLLIYFILPIFI